MKNYYDILGIRPTASRQEIKKSYRDLIKKHHPDRNPNDPKAHAFTQLLNEAYTALCKPLNRNINFECKTDGTIIIKYKSSDGMRHLETALQLYPKIGVKKLVKTLRSKSSM